jgi:hypothetical protein
MGVLCPIVHALAEHSRRLLAFSHSVYGLV